MKTNELHSYHGITRRNDSYGWVVQVRLLGQYRVIRSYAANAEQAARRHDIAICKLDAFTDANVRPNFPDDYKNVDLTRPADENGAAFHDELHKLFQSLCREIEMSGMDLDELRRERDAKAKNIETQRSAHLAARRAKLVTAAYKILQEIRMVRYDADREAKLTDLVSRTIELLK